jgi:aldehyde reductase
MAQKVMLPHEPKTQSFDLLSGHSIPAIGLGTWKSGSEAINSVKTAIVDVTYFHYIGIIILLLLLLLFMNE